MFIQQIKTLAKVVSASILALAVAQGQPATIKVTADNFYAVYSGNATAAVGPHGTGAYPTVGTHGFNVVGGFVYVAAWDDNAVYNGLLADLTYGNSFLTTSSNFWEVCATGVPLASGVANAPTAAALSAQILKCNNGGWHATSKGPANSNALQSGFWGKMNGIHDSTAWVWDVKAGVANCAGTNGFLKGLCNPGEYLIFRTRMPECPAPTSDFTVDFASGGFGSLTVNGSPANFEQNYFWSIQESNANWTAIGTEGSQWFAGTAGALDMKAFAASKGVKLECNKYYRVKLAVQNQCVSWVETTKLVKLGCCSEVVGGTRTGNSSEALGR